MKKMLAVMMFMMHCLLSMPSIAATATDEQYTHDFWAPDYHGKRLAYCLSDHHICGKAVADQYCQLQGYDRSTRSKINYNVGLTRYLNQDNDCTGWVCSGFKWIRCAAKTLHTPKRDYYYRSKTFVMPRFNHYRVDWCYTHAKHCGERPAFSFCRRHGYAKATHYKQEKGVAATRALGNQQVCFGKHCDGFASITCYR